MKRTALLPLAAQIIATGLNQSGKPETREVKVVN